MKIKNWLPLFLLLVVIMVAYYLFTHPVMTNFTNLLALVDVELLWIAYMEYGKK